MRINYLSFTKNRTKLYLDTQFPRGLKQFWRKPALIHNIYTSHSTRAASTTKAYSTNVPLNALMKAAGWKSENTFHRYYNKPVQTEWCKSDRAYSVLAWLLLLSYPVSCYDRQIYLAIYLLCSAYLLGHIRALKSHGISYLGVMW